MYFINFSFSNIRTFEICLTYWVRYNARIKQYFSTSPHEHWITERFFVFIYRTIWVQWQWKQLHFLVLEASWMETLVDIDTGRVTWNMLLISFFFLSESWPSHFPRPHDQTNDCERLYDGSVSFIMLDINRAQYSGWSLRIQVTKDMNKSPDTLHWTGIRYYS